MAKPENKKEAPQNKAALKQKTFVFQRNEEPSKIDEIVNDWLHKQMLESNMIQLSKCFSNHATGETIYVYSYMVFV